MTRTDSLQGEQKALYNLALLALQAGLSQGLFTMAPGPCMFAGIPSRLAAPHRYHLQDFPIHEDFRGRVEFFHALSEPNRTEIDLTVAAGKLRENATKPKGRVMLAGWVELTDQGAKLYASWYCGKSPKRKDLEILCEVLAPHLDVQMLRPPCSTTL